MKVLAIVALCVAAFPAFAQEPPMPTIHYSPTENLERIDRDLIATATTSIDMAAYVLTDVAVMEALSSASLRGVRVRVYLDGREPEVKDVPLPLPRRECRILEYLVRNRGRRVTKTQIFNAVYGIFDEDVDENVVESHISKLRKKLRNRLGYDPIDSKRYLGYQFD